MTAPLPWEEGEPPWRPAPEGGFEPETDDDEEWRGDVHLGDWPENLAGPEYWLYKRELGGGDGGGA